jgi:endonuclease/exonuclease/phosphatase family metal-dependent hydrolase
MPSDDAFFKGDHADKFRDGSELRAQQVAAFGELADRETDPVVIAGDTNLTSGSLLLRRHLSHFRDGFVAASWGFGYTFPTNRRASWMRLDRIFASEQLRIATFEVGDSKASDHYCVVADIQKKAP